MVSTAVRLECHDPRPKALQIKGLCGTSAERNNLGTKSERGWSLVRVRRTNRRPNRRGGFDVDRSTRTDFLGRY